MNVSWYEVLPGSRMTSRPGNPSNEAGIYLLVVAQEGGGWRPFYAGQAEYLTERLGSHWSATESNQDLKYIVGEFRCGYYYAEVLNTSERDKGERALIDHYSLTSLETGIRNGRTYRKYCNNNRPNAPIASLNWPV